MKSYLSLLFVVLVFVINGCAVRVITPPQDHYPPAERTNSDYDGRIEATKSIMNFVEQDRALSAIALDAAIELDIEHTVKALSLMTNFVTCDQTAENCVTPFLNENMITEANMIADEITNFVVKDRVLARIANGPAGSS